MESKLHSTGKVSIPNALKVKISNLIVTINSALHRTKNIEHIIHNVSLTTCQEHDYTLLVHKGTIKTW